MLTFRAFAGESQAPFYEARKGNLHLYIFGTMHLGLAGTSLPDEVLTAIGRSDRLLFELSEEETNAALPLMQSYMCKDACLTRLLPAETFAELKKEYGLILMALGNTERTPAWMVSMLIAQFDYLRAGYLPNFGSEELLKRAWAKKQDATAVIGLETAREQMQTLASLSPQTQREAVVDYLALSPAERVATVVELYKHWQSGDADALYHWYQQSERDNGTSAAALADGNEKLLFARNQRLAERALQHVEQGKTAFLAVGALHLGGNQGILSLLRQRGFTVKPI